MRPGFMSSVCPNCTLDELISRAETHGYEGIEFRVEWDHNHGIELDASAEYLDEARRKLVDHGLIASCVATGVRFNSLDPEEHRAQQVVVRQYIQLAAEIGAPYVRTFSDSLPEDDEAARNRVIELAAASYGVADDTAQAEGVTVLVETHTNMLAQWAEEILERSDARNLGVLWHIGHHLRRGQSVDEAYDHVQGHVRHVHFTAQEESEVVTDEDNQRSFELLAAHDFDGFFSVEIINPDDSDAVLAHHIRKFKQFMAGVAE